VETVDERGWERITNGELLKAAEEAGFELLVTADQNIAYQQSLKRLRLALLVLGSNIWPIVSRYAGAIAAEIDKTEPGSYSFFEMPKPEKHHEAEGS
jgi:hypothetical protein